MLMACAEPGQELVTVNNNGHVFSKSKTYWFYNTNHILSSCYRVRNGVAGLQGLRISC